MTDSTQPSILEYARYHGVASDYQAIELGELLPKQHGDTEGLCSEFEEAHLVISRRLEEKPSVSKAGADFLSSIINTAPGVDNARAWAAFLPDIPREADMKLVVPRLAIDNEEDLLSTRDKTSLDKLVIDLPLETVIDDNDESVMFPRYIQELPTEILEMVMEEKIHCTASAAETVRGMVRPGNILEYIPIPLPDIDDTIINCESEGQHPATSFNQLTDDIPDAQNGTCQGQGLSFENNERQENNPEHHNSPVAGKPLPPPSLRFSAPHSLSAFMSVRGRAKRQKSEHCPSFSTAREVFLAEGNIELSHKEPSLGQMLLKNSNAELELAETPVSDLDCGEVSIFVSTTVLKSHRSLLYHLETAPCPPMLIFRDYYLLPATPDCLKLSEDSSPKANTCRRIPDAEHEIWTDADFTISPCTGIILTTSQETTQLYLPGHTPKIPWADVELKSPLQERIYRTCMKYEHLYVFVCHSTSDVCGGKSTISVDERIAKSFHKLRTFCDSLNNHSSVTVTIVAPVATSLTRWIFHLTAKHRFPTPLPGEPGSGNDHGTPSTVNTISDSFKPPQQPTTEELSLRAFGMNSFAAWIIIYNGGDKQEPCSHTPHADAGTVSKFIHSPADERREVYGPILGDRFLSRLEKWLRR